MLIEYVSKTFRSGTQAQVDQANEIIEEFQEQGFTLTLRQLYYQMVSRDMIPNKQASYNRLGRIVTEARNAGLISWVAIEDRTRNLERNSHWPNPQSIIRSAIHGYAIDKWRTQPIRPEVWIEKDALTGVIAGICDSLDVAYFSCRGYVSASEIWKAGHDRIKNASTYDQQQTVILHLGDHDPSGIDMTRDIEERLCLYAEGEVMVDRLALNMDQVEQYRPPPNPAKITDSRATSYIEQYGRSSWELDALSPTVLAGLIETAVLNLRDEGLWVEAVEREEQDRQWLRNTIGE